MPAHALPSAPVIERPLVVAAPPRPRPCLVSVRFWQIAVGQHLERRPRVTKSADLPLPDSLELPERSCYWCQTDQLTRARYHPMYRLLVSTICLDGLRLLIGQQANQLPPNSSTTAAPGVPALSNDTSGSAPASLNTRGSSPYVDQ